MELRAMKALPSVPQCPGAQTKRTLLKIANDFNAFIASATRPVVALKAETALMAAKLSQLIATELLFLFTGFSSLAQYSRA